MKNIDKKIERIIWDSLGTKEESEKNHMLYTIFEKDIHKLREQIKSLISSEKEETLVNMEKSIIALRTNEFNDQATADVIKVIILEIINGERE